MAFDTYRYQEFLESRIPGNEAYHAFIRLADVYVHRRNPVFLTQEFDQLPLRNITESGERLPQTESGFLAGVYRFPYLLNADYTFPDQQFCQMHSHER